MVVPFCCHQMIVDICGISMLSGPQTLWKKKATIRVHAKMCICSQRGTMTSQFAPELNERFNRLNHLDSDCRRELNSLTAAQATNCDSFESCSKLLFTYTTNCRKYACILQLYCEEEIAPFLLRSPSPSSHTF